MLKLDRFQLTAFDQAVHTSLIPELTTLLHASYKVLADLGFRYNATHQKPEVTLSRITRGDGFLVFEKESEKLVGTISLVFIDSKEPCEWYQEEHVCFFTQFGIHPDYQQKGLGSFIMNFIEDHAKKCGMKEIALDTAEGASHLISMYEKRGYRFIQYANWSETNYKSVILSKTL